MSEQNIKSSNKFRLLVVTTGIVASAFVLLWRGVDLHVFNKDFLQNQGDARYLRVLPVAAHRGMIRDRQGEPLAISTPVDSVWVQPEEFISAHNQWSTLAGLLGLRVSQLQQMVLPRKDKEFVYIKRHVAPDLAKKVMALEIPGVSLQREYHRYYPTGEVTSHILGFTNVDDIGQEGIELAYNDWLKGSTGSQRVLKDRLGRVVKHIELLKAPKPGQDMLLSIDRRLQYLTYRELKRAVLKHKAKSGSAVVLDAKTGDVLAMVNQPSYNPNNRGQFSGASYRNRAVTDVFEPGSTVKPFTVAAALTSGKYQSKTLINTSPGTFRVGRHTIRDIRDYGMISVSKVLQKSSNIGASKMALALSEEHLWNGYAKVGFGESTGSGFPGEASGVFTRSQRWKEIERATLAYGYGLSVTPLQLARAYTVFATGGRLLPVSFEVSTQPVKGSAVMKAHTANTVRRMLETVIEKEGTGSKAAIPGYRVAGKTGTMKKASAGGYSEDRYISVFAGMVPASDPRLVMVVMVNEPSAEVYYGGEVAAPVFSAVMSDALRLFDIPPDNIDERKLQMAGLNNMGVRP